MPQSQGQPLQQNPTMQSQSGFMQSTGAGQGASQAASQPPQQSNYFQPQGGASQPNTHTPPPNTTAQPPAGSTASGPPPNPNMPGYQNMQMDILMHKLIHFLEVQLMVNILVPKGHILK